MGSAGMRIGPGPAVGEPTQEGLGALALSANGQGCWGEKNLGGGDRSVASPGGGGLRFRQRRRGLSRVFPREPLAVPWAIANGDVEQGWAGEGVAS